MNAVVSLNNTYFRRGAKLYMEELRRYKYLPDGFEKDYMSVIDGETDDDLRQGALALLRGVDKLYRQMYGELVPKASPSYENLRGTYEELWCNCRNKVIAGADSEDKSYAFHAALSAQNYLNEMTENIGTPKFDLMRHFDAHNLQSFKNAFLRIMDEYLAEYEKAGRKVERFDTFEQVYKRYMNGLNNGEINNKNLDYAAYVKNGVGDDFYTVGNYNLFMQCDSPNKTAFCELPHPFTFRLCRPDELEVWKRVAAEEDYACYLTEYYDRVYAQHADEFFRNCMFACDTDGKPVATGFIWRSYGKINTIAWLRVLPAYEGRRLGRAILSRILASADFPVYLHTQPTSARAIKLYSDFGFKLLTDPVIGYRKNNLSESLPYLQKVLPEGDYLKLRFAEADNALLEAAMLSEISEF